MDEEEAVARIRAQLAALVDEGKDGDINLYGMIGVYIEQRDAVQRASDIAIAENSAPFVAAAWQLCQRGILRPGTSKLRANPGISPSGGEFTLTTVGKQWLSEEQADLAIPADRSKTAEVLAKFKDRFGIGFFQRAMEAIDCYNAHAYLACCVMCGAAAESVLLCTAIAKSKDEADILKRYRSKNGRSQLISYIVGNATAPVQENVRDRMPVFKYWRDEAAHGAPSLIRAAEAQVSIVNLYAFARECDENWDTLVRGS